MAYLPIVRTYEARSYKETLVLIPVGWSFLLMGHRNYLWGSIASAINPDYLLSPELQIGIGLVPSLAWLGIVVFAVWLIIRSKSQSAIRSSQSETNLLFLSQLIFATCLVYLLGMRYWNDFSPWQFVYAYVPGGRVVRAVARYALVLALPMGIAFAFLIDLLIRKISAQTHAARRRFLFASLFVLTTFGLIEQFAHKEAFGGFSISAENQYLNRLAQSLPGDCSSFYVGLTPPKIHNQFEYQLDAMFVSVMKGLPTLNGYSGYLPRDWALWEVGDPQYEENVKRWITDRQIRGNVCRLFITERKPLINLEDPEVFIRQQYLDILRREPDESGLQTWLEKLNKSAGQVSKNSGRVSVSVEVLDSEEFRDRGYFVLRLYLATLGRPPLREEFVRDHDGIFSAKPRELEAKKDALVAEFVERTEFKSMYDQLSDAAFVSKLSNSRGDLVPALEAKQKTRAQVVRAVVDDPQTVAAFKNHAFVLMQFFGHLSRDPKPGEYEERLKRLNATGDYRQLVFDFIYSVEYRNRFGFS